MLSPDSLLGAAVAVVLVGAVVTVAWRSNYSVTHGCGEHVLAALWPDLWHVRRRALPIVERRVPALKAVLPGRTTEVLGYLETDPAALRRQLRAREDVYPNNAAALKYYPRDGDASTPRHARYEVGSYAWRPDGLFGTWQTHVRLFPTAMGGTVVLAHHEVSPLAGVGEGPVAILRQAVRHYRGVTLDDQRGVEEARVLLDDLDEWGEDS